MSGALEHRALVGLDVLCVVRWRSRCAQTFLRWDCVCANMWVSGSLGTRRACDGGNGVCVFGNRASEFRRFIGVAWRHISGSSRGSIGGDGAHVPILMRCNTSRESLINVLIICCCKSNKLQGSISKWIHDVSMRTCSVLVCVCIFIYSFIWRTYVRSGSPTLACRAHYATQGDGFYTCTHPYILVCDMYVCVKRQEREPFIYVQCVPKHCRFILSIISCSWRFPVCASLVCIVYMLFTWILKYLLCRYIVYYYYVLCNICSHFRIEHRSTDVAIIHSNGTRTSTLRTLHLMFYMHEVAWALLSTMYMA